MFPTDHQLDHARRWQALLDADLIGNHPPTPPPVAVQRDANAALFRGFAADRRRVAWKFHS